MKMSKVAPSGFNPRLRRHSKGLAKLYIEHDNRAPYFGLCQKRVSQEETNEQGRQLFRNFFVEEISKEPGLLSPAELEDELDISTPLNYAHPEWAKAGRGLRMLADDFMRSKERQKVKRKANEFGVCSVTQQQFRDLMSELLADGITKERIIVLFFFCADVAIASLKHVAETQSSMELCRQFLDWSIQFITEKICSWVQEHGGWGAIFSSSLQYLKKAAIVFGFGLAIYFGVRKLVRHQDS